MPRMNVSLPTRNEHLHAEVIDGEVVGFQPISINHLNSDIDTCIKYLETIKEAMERSKEKDHQ